MNEGAKTAEPKEENRDVEREVELVSVGEVERALRRMNVGKAAGPDGIPVEVWKIVGKQATAWLQRLFNRMLMGARMPKEWRESWVVPLYKGKGDAQECKNY